MVLLAIPILVVLLIASVFWVYQVDRDRDRLRRQARIDSAELRRRVGQLMDETEDIRGLEFSRLMDVRLVTPEELTAELESGGPPPDDFLRNEAKRLGFLGLIPLDAVAEYGEAATDSRSSGITGFYDDERKEMVVAVRTTGFDLESEATLVHELTHGLTDLVMGLEPPEETVDAGDDAFMAYRAVVEGDARFTEDRFIARRSPSTASTWPMTPGGPYRYVIEQESFPYAEGARFFEATFNRGGWKAVNALYDAPPTTTEQVLHPDKYLKREPAKKVTLPRLTIGDGWGPVDESVAGELGLRGLLRTVMVEEDAAAAAAGWGGDAWAHYENGRGTLVVHRFVADDDAALRRIHAALGRYAEAAQEKRGTFVKLHLEGEFVTLVQSTDETAVVRAAIDLSL